MKAKGPHFLSIINDLLHNFRAKIEYQAGKSTLIINNVTKGDTGTFTCVADNGVGDPAMAKADVIVKCEFVKMIALLSV